MGEGGHKGLLYTGCRVSVWDNVLEMDSDDGVQHCEYT